MNQIIQSLAVFVLKASTRQCENLTNIILEQQLNIESRDVNDLVKLLHDERVIRFKYSFQCPCCHNTNTVYEGTMVENSCQFCGEKLHVNKFKEGASIRYVLDRDDFEEFMEENFDRELIAAKQDISGKIGDSNRKERQIAENMNKDTKLFISHCSEDLKYVNALVEFFEDLGMTKDNMFCSSVNGYDIPWGNDIYEYLQREFNNSEKELLVLFVLSDNYYNSVPCLNEMGAAWILKKDYRCILLPGFEYQKIDGAIDPKQIGIKLDDDNVWTRLNDIREQFQEVFNLREIDANKWDRIRRNFEDKIKK